MTKRVSDLLNKIFYTLEVLPSLSSQFPNTLFQMYKEIIDSALLIDITDAHEKDTFDIFGKNIYYYSQDVEFLDTLRSANTISPITRAEVIGQLKSLDFAIRNATT